MAEAASTQHFYWHHTKLRIKDPKVSVPFYERHFGMRLVDEQHFAEHSFSVYLLASFEESGSDAELVASLPKPGTEEAHKLVWSSDRFHLMLTHNHGVEKQDDYKLCNGNVAPHRGFGHIAFNTADVYAVCDELLADGVRFQKKPDEGNMKGLAFALDPDGYWVEIVKRADSCKLSSRFNISQTMLRVSNAEASLAFYRDHLHMNVICEKHFPQWEFSLYFLSSHDPSPADSKSEEAFEYMKSLKEPVLELTVNYNSDEVYHNGNSEPFGFGHIAFLVDDVEVASQALEKAGVSFKKKPSEGTMHNIAFALDPEGYHVELVQRGTTF